MKSIQRMHCAAARNNYCMTGKTYLVLNLKYALTEMRRMRETIRVGDDRGHDMGIFKQHKSDEVYVPQKVNEFSRALGNSATCQATIFKLRMQGGVNNLYLADALQNTLRRPEGCRWRPQVLVFFSYVLSISGRKAYDAYRKTLVFLCTTTLLKYLHKCSLNRSVSADNAFSQCRRYFERNSELPRVLAVSDDSMKISETIVRKIALWALYLSKFRWRLFMQMKPA